MHGRMLTSLPLQEMVQMLADIESHLNGSTEQSLEKASPQPIPVS